MASRKLPNGKGWQYSKRFEEGQKKIEPDCQRFDEMIEAALESIAANPTLFAFVDEEKKLQSCRVRTATKDGAIKPVTIYFIDLPETVYLVDVIETPVEE